MSHHCHAQGCTAPVRPAIFVCGRHWKLLPKPLQRAIYVVYRPGQEDDKKPSRGYMIVQTTCRIAIAQAESRGVDVLHEQIEYWSRGVDVWKDCTPEERVGHAIEWAIRLGVGGPRNPPPVAAKPAEAR